MKKISLCLFAIVLFSVLIIKNASGWFPNTHTYIINKIEEKSIEIQNFSYCFDNSVNEQAIRAGNILPDITAIDYINPNKNYKATHSWNFQQKLLDMAESQDEKCLAYGVSIHLIADSVAHEKFIPSKIKKIGLLNWIIHLLIEEKIDECLVYKNKHLIVETEKSLDVFYDIKEEEYIKNIKNSLGTEIDLNVKKNINRLNLVLNVLKNIIIADKPVGNSLNSLELGCNEAEINDYMQQIEDLAINNFKE